MNIDLPLAFDVLMGFAILAYVVLDGYDLGVGMLMPAADGEEQETMVSSIAPFWDANETWLVLGVGILLVAFPAAHGIVLGALYLPTMVMLIGIIFRGAAFEFRIKAVGWHRELWNWLFWFGSFLASFAQGAMLGRYITGFAPGFGFVLFAIVTGASLCGAYVLLGASWLVMKTDGGLQRKAIVWAMWGLVWIALGVFAVSVATPLVSATVRARWFDYPHTLPLLLLPAATLVLGFIAAGTLRRLFAGTRSPEWLPFACAVGIFVLAFAGLAYSLFPYVVIDRLTFRDAAADESALRFVWAGTIVVVPLIVAYTAFVHRVFRGKAQKGIYAQE
jgi:cytochrome d ubiquinol oxidase subunit II